MSTEQQNSAIKTRHRVEGPKNHYITYIVSIVLTMLAFAAVIYGGLSKAFLVSFLILLAAVQAVFQLAVWMHMKDKEHTFPIIGIIFGVIFGMCGVVAALFWIWW
ncbi:cytochrome C oxidase subunit IV family protein [Paenibacillus sp. J2TS4]|uniref:cytochrome C oxidase subunit IV family protein n=1 Tax=Paenibacillus sp. J2TS4 TaxID=2807194 RepID=UPI001B0CD8A5|nr:cytochrome C oxidase subunit IV family protein [Paenibacillus sp. J2TS4]GIP34827.1 hypothetical protein J2TS4_40370 [Paenibacillus sp. J2TS4]